MEKEYARRKRRRRARARRLCDFIVYKYTCEARNTSPAGKNRLEEKAGGGGVGEASNVSVNRRALVRRLKINDGERSNGSDSSRNRGKSVAIGSTRGARRSTTARACNFATVRRRRRSGDLKTSRVMENRRGRPRIGYEISMHCAKVHLLRARIAPGTVLDV